MSSSSQNLSSPRCCKATWRVFMRSCWRHAVQRIHGSTWQKIALVPWLNESHIRVRDYSREYVQRPRIVGTRASYDFFSFSEKFRWHIFTLIIWPVRHRVQFPWKTMREKVPYEGRMRRSDRAGKTRTVLPEMRTTCKERVRQNRCKLMTKTIFLL